MKWIETSIETSIEKLKWNVKLFLPEKEQFYSHLNMEDITDAGYAHAKIVCEDFEIRFRRYRNLYVQSNILLWIWEL